MIINLTYYFQSHVSSLLGWHCHYILIDIDLSPKAQQYPLPIPMASWILFIDYELIINGKYYYGQIVHGNIELLLWENLIIFPSQKISDSNHRSQFYFSHSHSITTIMINTSSWNSMDNHGWTTLDIRVSRSNTTSHILHNYHQSIIDNTYTILWSINNHG